MYTLVRNVSTAALFNVSVPHSRVQLHALLRFPLFSPTGTTRVACDAAPSMQALKHNNGNIEKGCTRCVATPLFARLRFPIFLTVGGLQLQVASQP